MGSEWGFLIIGNGSLMEVHQKSNGDLTTDMGI